MKKQIADKWVKALRSGEYEQGKSQLRNKFDNTYCCLGVLCEISKKGFIDSNWNLSKEIQTWAGMATSNGSLEDKIHYTKSTDLTILNDIDNMSFDEIADIIQMTWKEL